LEKIFGNHYNEFINEGIIKVISIGNSFLNDNKIFSVKYV